MQIAATQQTFWTLSRQIAENFLQSVVVVDDEAWIQPSKTEPIPTADLRVPGGRGISKTLIPSTDDQKEVNQGSDVTQPEGSEVLNAKVLTDSFAKYGLVCSVLNPFIEERESILDTANNVARRADIVVLDWKINEQENIGETTLRTIQKIIDSDEAGKNGLVNKQRLRLIAIYTSMPNLVDILEQVRKTLNIDEAEVDNFSLKKGAFKITFYKKDNGVSVATPIQSRIVSEKDLPNRLIDDFTAMTQGLLSNVVLSAFGELRENTHRILSKFSSTIDAPYLTHRALTNPSHETQAHPVPLLSSEIEDILEYCSVDDAVNTTNISLWMNEKLNNNELDGKVNGLDHLTLKALLTELVTSGINYQLKKQDLPELYKGFIDQFQGSAKDDGSILTNLLSGGTNGKHMDREFSMLTTVRSRYAAPPPLLSLGSIVVKKINTETHYYLCIQPICDSVRFKDYRKFPFLKLIILNDTGPVDLVVKVEQAFLDFRINFRPHDLTFFSIRADNQKKVAKVTKTVNGGNDLWNFTAKDEAGSAVTLQWIADLKFPHAQRIAEQFAGQLSRVGLTESEWLRRMAIKNNWAGSQD